jgi:hypothetical protein
MSTGKHGYVIEDEDDDVGLDEMSGLHPTGSFQAVLVQLPFFRAESKDRDGMVITDDYRVFSFQTEDDEGVRRIIDSNKMTQKPFSDKSTMGKVLKAMFGVSKPESLQAAIPSLSVLLGMNFMLGIEHATMQGGGSPFASIASFAPIPVIKGKPAVEPIQGDESYVNYFERKKGFKRIPSGKPGKEMWFKPLFEEKTEEELKAEREEEARNKAAASKALKAAPKSVSKPTFADDNFDDSTEDQPEEEEEVEEAPPAKPTRPQSRPSSSLARGAKKF